MLKVGDKLTRVVRVSVLEHSKYSHFEDKKISCPAVVVFIHPEHRFYTLRISLPNGATYLDTEYFGPKRAGE